MRNNNIEYEKIEDIGTVIYIAINNKFAGKIVIADSIKEDSHKAVKKLRTSTKKVVMLSRR